MFPEIKQHNQHSVYVVVGVSVITDTFNYRKELGTALHSYNEH